MAVALVHLGRRDPASSLNLMFAIQDEAGLLPGWRQILFPHELPMVVEHSVQVVDGARHSWLPWMSPESYNHEMHVAVPRKAIHPAKFRQTGLIWPILPVRTRLATRNNSGSDRQLLSVRKTTSDLAAASANTLPWAIDNPHLAQAIAFIRTHAAEPIRVTDVLQRVPLSRRQLEQEFQRVLGRSPAQEIRRVHLERAQQLLAETDLSIPAVASSSGFNSPEHFARTFKARFGRSPLKHRTLTRRTAWQETEPIR